MSASATSTVAGAIEHVLGRIHESPEVGYYMGVCTESFERLVAAYAEIHGEPVAAVRTQFLPMRPRDPRRELERRVEELEERLTGTHTSCHDDDAPTYGPEHLDAEDMVERVKLLLGMHSADPVRCQQRNRCAVRLDRPPDQPRRPPHMKTITGYIVMQGGRPCTLWNAAARAETKRGGVLVPGSPVATFSRSRDAKRAIARTQRAAGQLAGTLIDDWVKLLPLQSGQPYSVEPLTTGS